MIHALHGNVSDGSDLVPMLEEVGLPYHVPNLWTLLRQHRAARTLSGTAELIRPQGGDRPRVLLGYSMGARLALHALVASPAEWDAAVLISAHPGLADTGERSLRLQQDLVWSARMAQEPVRRLLRSWNQQPALTATAECPAAHRAGVYYRREIARAFDLWSLGRQENLRPTFPRIACPVLWVTGERDEKFTSLAAGCAPLFPNARHEVIVGAGHRVHLDQPAATAGAIRAFAGLLVR